MVRTHTVVAGETLSALALRFYGDAELYRLIATASVSPATTVCVLTIRLTPSVETGSSLDFARGCHGW